MAVSCSFVTPEKINLDLKKLDQAHQIALAKDPLSHAVGVELLKPIELLANADELDRNLGHFFDRQGRTASGMTRPPPAPRASARSSPSPASAASSGRRRPPT